MSGLKKIAVRGAAWTIVGFGTRQVMRFGGNLVLTYLLVPEFFGIMAVANGLIIGMELFSDLGIQQNIVHSKNGTEPDFLNTAWTLQIIRGLVIFTLVAIAAWPIARYYQEPVLAPVIMLIGFSKIIDGFVSTKLWLLNRELKLGWFTSLELLGHSLGIVCMILWAWFNPSIWALPVGNLAATTFKVLVSHGFLPGPRNQFAWHRQYLEEMVSFGRWMVLATATMFLSEQADRFILAKLLSFSVLGVYTVAVTLAQLPKQIIKQLNHRVIFPVVSRNAELPRSVLRTKILGKRKVILFAFSVGLSVGIAFGDLLIAHLYDERYLNATWMFSILCLGIWFSVLFYTSVPCLLGVGKPIYSAQGNFARLVMVVVGMPLGHSIGGTFGAIATIAISDLPAYLTLQYGLSKEKLSFYQQDLLTTSLLLLLVGLFLGMRYYSGLGTPFDLLLT